MNIITEANVKINKHSTDIKDGVKTVSLSLPVGFKYHFNTPWAVGLSYDIPLTDTSKKGGIKTGGLLLTGGYSFTL